MNMQALSEQKNEAMVNWETHLEVDQMIVGGVDQDSNPYLGGWSFCLAMSGL